jgi:hypothetical protein
MLGDVDPGIRVHLRRMVTRRIVVAGLTGVFKRD